MKKTLLTFGVLSAVVCGTLAYAVTGHGQLALFENSNAPAQEPKSLTSENVKTSVANHPRHGMQINRESMLQATSCVAAMGSEKAPKAASSRQDNVQEVFVDLWSNAKQLYAVNGGTFDAATNTLTFPGSSENSNQIFTEINESGEYGWFAAGGHTYQFSGTLSSDGTASVYPCIVYYNGNGLYVANQSSVQLNESNGYTADFSVSASGIQKGNAIMVAFIIENSSSDRTITSTGNQFSGSCVTHIAQEWTSENDLPGLGLSGFDYGAYTVTCEDGLTTLGLFYDGSLYVTGINTTAAEVALPLNITIGDNIEQINCFGYDNQMDWSGAPNLTTLDLTTVANMNAPFSGSAITDLYVKSNVGFQNNPAGIEEIYLHIPYGTNRGDYTDYGFKWVLVGDEQPNYPVTYNSYWVIAGENEGDFFGISVYDGYFTISEIFTDKESVELPAVTPANGGTYYIRYFGEGTNNRVLCQNAPALESVTIPETYTRILVNWSYTPIVDLHMQGDVPSTDWSLSSGMTVYLADQSYLANYEGNSSWNRAEIIPEGWDSELIIVNVKKPGEFAQTYLDENNNSWEGFNVKIIGNLNSIDLGNIVRLERMMRLDLSETTIEYLPKNFLQNMVYLKEVVLPSTVTAIDSRAFYRCNKLKTVSVNGENKVGYIGEYAFMDCSNLKEFDASKVEKIGSHAFYNCKKLDIPSIKSAKNIGNYAFAGSGLSKIDTDFFSPDITNIVDHAFDQCKSLEKVELPATITNIGENSFYGCSSLASLTLPSNLWQIGNYAFYGTALSELDLPDHLRMIGSEAFGNCRNVVTVKSRAVSPPLASGEFLPDVDFTYVDLYVPPISIDAYRSADYWSSFYKMRDLIEPIGLIYVDRPVTINLEEEANELVSEKPAVTLADYIINSSSWNSSVSVGELTIEGAGTLSASVINMYPKIDYRDNGRNTAYNRPSLINKADKMRTDSLCVQMEMYGDKWHFITLPYDVQVKDIIPSANTYWVIRRYDGANRAAGETANTWVDLTADDVMQAGRGYIVRAYTANPDSYYYTVNPQLTFPSRNTVTKNNIFRSTDAIVELEEHVSEFAHNRSWNLTGNPYPAYFYTPALKDQSGEQLTTPVTIWRGESYQAYSPVDDELILRPFESFFIQRPLDSENIVFPTEGRMHYSEAYSFNSSAAGMFAPAKVKAETRDIAERQVFDFRLSAEGLNDNRARIVFNEEASAGYDIDRDAVKFFTVENSNPLIYVAAGENFEINERPFDDGRATLGIQLAADGAYTISLGGKHASEWKVWLTDNYTGVRVDLAKNDYTFEGEQSADHARFTIEFEKGTPSGIENIAAISADAEVMVSTIDGVNIYSGAMGGFVAPAPGVYLVSVDGRTLKMFIEK